MMPLSMKGLVKTLRRKWRKGTYTDFDELLSEIANCDLETAQKIRETWEDMDILAYDQSMFLVWYDEGLLSDQNRSQDKTNHTKAVTSHSPKYCCDCEEATIHQTGSQLWISCRLQSGWRSINDVCNLPRLFSSGSLIEKKTKAKCEDP